jgi:16S rRNA (cytosine1402-N4)-methyltransferase
MNGWMKGVVGLPQIWNRFPFKAMHESLFHRSVLLREAIDALNIRPNGIYVDGTFGRGGHSVAILRALGPEGRLLALDRDPEAESFAKKYFQTDCRFLFVRGTFGCLAKIVEEYRLGGQVQGVLLDLGVSSPQLDDPKRGFSFSKDGPLDMRMDPTTGVSAAQWLMSCPEEELSSVLRRFGEERFHRRIAKAITAARQLAPINTTSQLAQIIAKAVPTWERGKHPATRSFQAIRIFINRELAELQAALEQALQMLAPGGRLVVISFHSLEDRMVKRFMRTRARGSEWPLDLPVPVSQQRSGVPLKVIGSAIRPSAEETEGNPRARSAMLRVAERLK